MTTDIRIDPAVRQKRMEQMQELYDLALANNDMCKEELYTLIKKITNENKQEIENQAIDYIYTALEQVMVITLQEARKIYKKLKDNKRISIEELFYKADEKTLDERVRERIEQDWDTLTLLYYLGVILDTETFQIIHQTIKSKVNIDYIEIVGAGCENCTNVGEITPADEAVLPPYHPNCCCQAIGYTKEDVLQDIN